MHNFQYTYELVHMIVELIHVRVEPGTYVESEETAHTVMHNGGVSCRGDGDLETTCAVTQKQW